MNNSLYLHKHRGRVRDIKDSEINEILIKRDVKDSSTYINKRLRDVKNLEKNNSSRNLNETAFNNLNTITHITKKHRGSGGKFLKQTYTAPKIYRKLTLTDINAAVSDTLYNKLIITSVENTAQITGNNIQTQIQQQSNNNTFLIKTQVDTVNYNQLTVNTKQDIIDSLTNYFINILQYNPGSFIIILSPGSLVITVKLVNGNITTIKLKNEETIYLNQNDLYIEYGAEAIINGIINNNNIIIKTFLLNNTEVFGVNSSIAQTYIVKYDFVFKNQIKDFVSRTVIITDNIPPVIQILTPAVITISQNLDYSTVDPGINITDTGGDIEINLRNVRRVIKNENGDEVNYNTFTQIRGTYYIHYFVIDAAGNEGTNIRRVNVIDTMDPVITLNTPINFNLNQNELYISNDPGIQNITDIGGDSAINLNTAFTITVTNSDDIEVVITSFTEIVGTYKLTYSVVDDRGNIGTVIRIINVIDNIGPVITLAGVSNYIINQGESFTDPGVTNITDTGGDINISTSDINIEIKDPLNNISNYSYPLNTALQANIAGIYTISYKATDNANNETIVIRTINVEDKTIPVINLNDSNISLMQGEDFTSNDPGILNVTDTGGDENISNRIVTKTVVDSNGVTRSISSFTQIIGTYTVTYTVQDDAGNVGSAHRTVVIIDNIPPVITLTGALNLQIRQYDTFTESGITSVTDPGGDDIISTSYVTKDIFEITNYLVKVNTKSVNHIDYANGSGSCYVLNDIETPALTFSINKTYRFIQDDNTNTNHPIKFYLDKQRNTLYETNVTYNLSPGVIGSYSEIQIDSSTPDVLYYQCGNHNLMGGKILVYNSLFGLSNFVNRLGLYELRYTVLDSKYNEGSASRLIHIYDNTSPTIILSGNNLTLFQGDILSNNDPGIDRIIDNNGSVNGDLVMNNGDVILEIKNSSNQIIVYDQVTQTAETYTFTYTITDSAGNIGIATRTVTVVNNIPPTITLVEPINMILYHFQAYNEPGIISIIDDVDGIMSINSYTQDIIEVKNYTVIVQTSPSVFLINNAVTPILTFKMGETYKFIQDDNTNINHPIKFYLDVDKLQEYTNGISIVSTPGTIGSYSQIQVDSTTPSIIYYQCENHNNMGGKIIVNNTTFDLINFVTRLGIYLISYTATDLANNTGTVYRSVNIIKNNTLTSSDPVITLTGSTEFTLNVGDTFIDPGIQSIQSNGTDTISSYNISPIITNSDNTIVDISTFTQTAGIYTLTYTVSDSGGNTQTATRTITISTAVQVEPPQVVEQWGDHQYFGIAPTVLRPSYGDIIAYDFEVVQNGVDIIENSPNLGSSSIPGDIVQVSPALANNTWIGFYYAGKNDGYHLWWGDNEEPILFYKTNDATPATGNITVRFSWHSHHMTTHGHFVSSATANGPWVIRASWYVPIAPGGLGEYFEWPLYDSTPPTPGSITLSDSYINSTGMDDHLAQPDSLSVSRDGKRVAVGTFKYGPDNLAYGGASYRDDGMVRVFEWINNNWTQIGNSIIDDLVAAEAEKLGRSVSLNSDGTRLIIGGGGQRHPDPNTNQPYVHGWAQAYELNGTTWVKMGQFINGIAKHDEFSNSLDMNDDGTIIAIGAYKRTIGGMNRAGQIRVFKYNSTTQLWFQLGQNIDGDSIECETGTALALNHDGTWLVSGEPNGNRREVNNWRTARGQVRIYQLDPNVAPVNWETQNPQWIQRGNTISGFDNLVQNDGESSLTGASVSLSNHNGVGLRIAYGSPMYWPESDGGLYACGSINVLEWNGTSWINIGSKIIGEREHRIGKRVSISSDGNRIVTVSGLAPYASTTTGGYMYIYDWNGTEWVNLKDTGYSYSMSLLVGETMSNHALSVSANGKVVMVGESSYYNQTYPNGGFPVDGRVARYDIYPGIYEPPIITLLGDAEITLEENSVFVDPGTTVGYSSGNPATIIPTIIDAGYNTIGLSSLTENPGVYNLTYRAVSSNGDTGFVLRKVTVTAIPKSNDVTFLTSVNGLSSVYTMDGHISLNGDATMMSSLSVNKDRINIYTWVEPSKTWNKTHEILLTSVAGASSSNEIFKASLSITNNRIGFTTHGSYSIYGFMYELNETTNTWEQVGDRINSNGIHRGWEMSINSDGTMMAVGASQRHYKNGGIYIYERKNDSWVVKGKAFGVAANDEWSIGPQLADGTVQLPGVFDWNPSSYSGSQISMSSDGMRISNDQKKEKDSAEHQIHVYEYGINGNLYWNKIGSTIIAKYGKLSPDGNRLATHNVAGQHISVPSEIKVYEWNQTINDWEQLGNTIIGGRNDGNGGMQFSDDGNILAVLGVQVDVTNELSSEYSSLGSPGRVTIYQLAPNVSNDMVWLKRLSQLGPLLDVTNNPWANDYPWSLQSMYIDKNATKLIFATPSYNSNNGIINTYSLPARHVMLLSDASVYPVITLYVSNNIELSIATLYSEYGIIVSHNKEITNTIDNPGPKLGRVQVNIDNFYNTQGRYTFTYSATDVDGKITFMDRIVNVIDNTGPVISIIGGDVYLITGYNNTYGIAEFTDYGLESVIDYGGDGILNILDVRVEIRTNNDELVTNMITSSPEIYTITYDISDSLGNLGVATRKVTISDTADGYNQYISTLTFLTSVNGLSSVYTMDGHISLNGDATMMSSLSVNKDRINIYTWVEPSKTWNKTHEILLTSVAGASSSNEIFKASLSITNNRIGFTTHGSYSIYGFMYELNETTNTWEQVGDRINSNGIHRGWEMSINSDGTMMAVGASQRHYKNGGIYIYERKNDSWVVKGKAFGVAANDEWSIGPQLADGTVQLPGVFDWNPSSYSGSQISMSSDGMRISNDQKKEKDSAEHQIHVYEYGINGNLYWNKIGSTIIAKYGKLSPDGNRLATHNVAGQHISVPSEIKVYEWNQTINDWEQLGNTIIGGRNDGNGGMQFSDDGNILAVLGVQVDVTNELSSEYSSLGSPGRVTIYQLAPNVSNDMVWLKRLSQLGPLLDVTNNPWANDYPWSLQSMYIDKNATKLIFATPSYNSNNGIINTYSLPDITPPVITLNGGDMSIAYGSTFTDPGVASVSDNVDTNLTVSGVTITIPANIADAGTHSISYYLQDSLGNETTVYRQVIVDNIGPVITLNNGNMSIIQGTTFTDPGVASVSDNVDTNLTVGDVTITIPANIADVGTHSISYYLQDSLGNDTTVYRQVVVSPPITYWYWPNDTNLVSYIMDYHTNYNNGTSPVGGALGAWARAPSGPISITEEAYHKYYDLKHGACTENPGRFSGPAGALPSGVAWKHANSPYRIDPAVNGYPELVFTFNNDTYCSGFRQKSNATNSQEMRLKDFEVYYNTVNNLSSGWQLIGSYTHANQMINWNSTEWVPVRCKLLKIRLKMSYWGPSNFNPPEYDCTMKALNLKIAV